jgi:glycosyltransferase involved in cell wall biosynthesis
MRLLILRWGSLEQSPHVVTLANFLASQGFEVRLVTVEAGPRPASLAAGVFYAALGQRKLSGSAEARRLPRLALTFRRVARAVKPDALWVVDSWTLPLTLAAGAGRVRALAPIFIYHTFDWLDPAHPNRIQRWYERYVCRRADLCVNVDRSRARLAQSLYRLGAAPFWLPNYPGLDEPAPQPDEALRTRLLGGRGGRFLVVCASAAAPGRLHAQLVHAVSLLPAGYRVVTFAGSGSYYGECLRLADGLGVRDRVMFLATCPFEELARIVACADVGVILNDWKTSSGYWMANPGRLALHLLTSVPVVTSDVPGLAALVYRWGLGECCNAYDPYSIAAAIRKVAEGPPDLERRREAVRHAFLEELHFERRGLPLVRHLRQLCGGRSPGALEDKIRCSPSHS